MEIRKKIAALIEVRKSIALLLTFTFIYLSVSGAVSPAEFIPIFTMVIGYYYGRSTALDQPKKE